MKKSYTREKKTLCGEGYMEVDLYRITPEEHAAHAHEADDHDYVDHDGQTQQ